jgi:hypothetical protein
MAFPAEVWMADSDGKSQETFHSMGGGFTRSLLRPPSFERVTRDGAGSHGGCEASMGREAMGAAKGRTWEPSARLSLHAMSGVHTRTERLFDIEVVSTGHLGLPRPAAMAEAGPGSSGWLLGVGASFPSAGRARETIGDYSGQG